MPAQSDCISLNFSVNTPIAWIKQNPVSLSCFYHDIQHLRSAFSGKKYVILSARGRYRFAVSLLAAWLEKKIVILPPNRLEYTLSEISSRFDVDLECGDTPPPPQSLTTNERDSDWRINLPTSQPAVVLYTSGSTGQPKLVENTIGGLLHEAYTLSQSRHWNPGSVIASVPPQHLYGLTFSVLLPWVLGKAIVDESPELPANLSELAVSRAGGILISIPLHYQSLIKTGVAESFSTYTCVSAAAPLPLETALAWKDITGNEIFEIYGSTETGVIASRQQVSEPYWTPINKVSINCIDSLLQIQSPYMGSNIPTPFLSSDQVEITDKGTFSLLGRVDSIVKIGGKRVSMTQIEQVLVSHPCVDDAAVIDKKITGSLRETTLWAAIKLKENEELSITELKSYCRSRMDGTFLPRHIRIVDIIPRSSNGKILKPKVHELFAEPDHSQDA